MSCAACGLRMLEYRDRSTSSLKLPFGGPWLSQKLHGAEFSVNVHPGAPSQRVIGHTFVNTVGGGAGRMRAVAEAVGRMTSCPLTCANNASCVSRATTRTPHVPAGTLPS